MSGVLTLPFLCLVLFNAPDMACQASQASRPEAAEDRKRRAISLGQRHERKRFP
jgi:hypothetical protein